MTQIRKLRKILGYTQSHLAKLLGVSRSTVAMWETSSQEPDYDTLKTISLLFHVPADFVMGRGIFSQWDNIIRYYDDVSFKLRMLIPSGLYLPTFSGSKTLIGWLDTRQYGEPDELELVRWFDFAVGDIKIVPIDEDQDEPKAEIAISFTLIFSSLISSHEPDREVSIYTPKHMKLLSLFRELNDEGQDRLIEQADDMVQSEKYIKPSSFRLGQQGTDSQE